MTLRIGLLAALALALAGCATPRAAFTPDQLSLARPVGFPVEVRVDAAAVGLAPGFLPAVSVARGGGIDILAISGGGAQGAYGAGVMVGWTAHGDRPEFQLVTGVSTGALIAPFAFLGPAWDARLKRAFAQDPAVNHVLRLRGPALLWRSGVFQGGPLRKLIAAYVDDALVRAVAAEDARGRRLWIATTELDNQRTVVWNMGAIARRGGPKAVALFRDVLAASISVPGAFPPVMIPVESGAARFSEMHVDGSTTNPFFSVPESLLLWSPATGERLRGRLSVILNAQVRPSFRVVPQTPIPVAKDALLTLNNAFARTSLAATEAFCRRNGLTFRLATLPTTAVSGGLMDFRASTMRTLFASGEAAARTGRAFQPRLEENALDRAALAAGVPPSPPAEGSPSASLPPGASPPKPRD